MPKVAQHTHRLQVDIPENRFEQLKQLAIEDETSVAQLVRYAIRDYLKAQER
ncbi:MAG TPA: CopG family transcriptional regulator [Thermoanaerobaculia bacterium]|jgi:hypothetical protein